MKGGRKRLSFPHHEGLGQEAPGTDSLSPSVSFPGWTPRTLWETGLGHVSRGPRSCLPSQGLHHPPFHSAGSGLWAQAPRFCPLGSMPDSRHTFHKALSCPSAEDTRQALFPQDTPGCCPGLALQKQPVLISKGQVNVLTSDQPQRPALQ